MTRCCAELRTSGLSVAACGLWPYRDQTSQSSHQEDCHLKNSQPAVSRAPICQTETRWARVCQTETFFLQQLMWTGTADVSLPDRGSLYQCVPDRGAPVYTSTWPLLALWSLGEKARGSGAWDIHSFLRFTLQPPVCLINSPDDKSHRRSET